jgi:hypothetical protein
VTQQELYLFEFASRCVTQSRARPAQVMRRKFVDRGLRCKIADDMPDNLLGYPFRATGDLIQIH